MENYLSDVLYQLIESASLVKQEANTDFKMGVLQGYYEAISRLLNEAEAFDITEQLPKNLQDYCPEDLFDKDKDGNVQ
jgi:hypothetical protein